MIKPVELVVVLAISFGTSEILSAAEIAGTFLFGLTDIKILWFKCQHILPVKYIWRN